MDDVPPLYDFPMPAPQHAAAVADRREGLAVDGRNTLADFAAASAATQQQYRHHPVNDGGVGLPEQRRHHVGAKGATMPPSKQGLLARVKLRDKHAARHREAALESCRRRAYRSHQNGGSVCLTNTVFDVHALRAVDPAVVARDIEHFAQQWMHDPVAARGFPDPVAMLDEMLATDLTGDDEEALLWDLSETLIYQTTIVGTLSALFDDERVWAVCHDDDGDGDGDAQPALMDAVATMRGQALTCLASLRLRSRDYVAVTRLNPALAYAASSYVLHAASSGHANSTVSPAVSPAVTEGADDDSSAAAPARATVALVPRTPVQHAVMVAATRCAEDVIQCHARMDTFEYVESALGAVLASHMFAALLTAVVDGAAAAVLPYVARLLIKAAAGCRLVGADHQRAGVAAAAAPKTPDMFEDEVVRVCITALERYADDDQGRGHHSVAPYVRWDLCCSIGLHHPDEDVRTASLALLSKYDEATAAAFANTPALMAWVEAALQRNATRLVALNLLRAAPWCAGHAMGTASSRSQTPLGLFAALCGVVRGRDRTARRYCLELLVAIRNEGYVDRVVEFCECNAPALLDTALGGSDHRDTILEPREMEIVEELLQLVDTDLPMS